MKTLLADRSPTVVQNQMNNLTGFVQAHQTLFQIVGVGLLSAAGGAWLGLSLAKGWALSQGIALAPTPFAYNVLPLTVGVAGGGTIGAGSSQRQVRDSKARLLEQIRQTEQAQQETARLQAALAATEAQLAAQSAEQLLCVFCPVGKQDLGTPTSLSA